MQMTEELLDDPRSQLATEGIESPEAMEVDSRGLHILSPHMTCSISGGFQQVGFGKGFGQTVGPGDFAQTYFTQLINKPK
jgi:hypothetical protein